MRRFSKTLLSIAAISAVSTAMAVSAMAMEASYKEGTVNLSGVTSTGASQTLLVLNTNAETVAEANIVQIDQKDDSTSFATVPVGTLKDGTYYVRIGGTDGTLQKAEFKVGGSSVETEKIIIGDVNGDNAINSMDTIMVSRKAASSPKSAGNAGVERTLADTNEKIIIGDVNDDKAINSMDTIMVSRKAASSPKSAGNAGKEVTVVK